MKKLLAFQLVEPDYNFSWVVFAKNAKQAKEASIGCFDHDKQSVQDLFCRRIPVADKYATRKPTVLDPTTRKASKIYYELGWRLKEDSPVCERCYRGEFKHFPKSKLASRNDCDGKLICEQCYEYDREQ